MKHKKKKIYFFIAVIFTQYYASQLNINAGALNLHRIPPHVVLPEFHMGSGQFLSKDML